MTGGETVGYEQITRSASSILTGTSSEVSTRLMEKILDLVQDEKFEEAAIIRDRMHALEDGIFRSSRLREITAIPLIIAARPNALGGWEIHAISHGRFAGSVVAPPGADPKPYLSQLKNVLPVDLNLPTLVAEVELLLKWLGDGVTRLVEITDGHSWRHPLHAHIRAGELLGA